jgi:hypothetical protein
MRMQSHTIVGKSVLILTLIFCITVIGEESSSFPRGDYRRNVSQIDTLRKKNDMILKQVEDKLKLYELTEKKEVVP